MARRNRSLYQPEAAHIVDDLLEMGERVRRLDARANPRQDEILGLSGYRSRVLWPKFQDGGGVNSGSLSAADGRARVRGALFDRDINFLSNMGKGGGKKNRNPRQDQILGLSGYKARVLYPKFEDGGGVNSGSLDARDGRARVGGSLFTNEINFLTNKKKSRRTKQNAYEYTGQGPLNNPRQDEILGISGYHARVLWPKFSLTGGVNSGNADYIPTMTTGSLFNREINFLSNPAGEVPNGDVKIVGRLRRHGKEKMVTVRQVLTMPQMFRPETVEEAHAISAGGAKANGRGGRKNRRNPSKEKQVQALAREVNRTWAKVSPYAEQQLLFMLHPEYITGGDTIEMVVASFLANAQGWRGDDAKRIKAQLKALL
jgi:hypothetical protein